MSIVLLDSGLGGLTVLHEALQWLPHERYIYFADNGNVPYGTKPKETVRACILSAVRELVTEETKALLIACNTATSIAIADLRHQYSIPVIGMEPAVKPAVELSRNTGKRVLVFATPLALKEAKYHDLVNRLGDSGHIDSQPMPGLVTLAEEMEFDGPRVQAYLQETLGGYSWEKYGTVVLGCTHFSFFRTALSAFLPPYVQLIDGSAGTVRRLYELTNGGREEHADAAGPGRERSDRQKADLVPPQVEFRHSGPDSAYTERMRQALDWYRCDREAADRREQG